MDSEDFKAMLVTERMQMHYGEFRKENPAEPAKIHREDQIEWAFERVVEKLDTKSQKILRDYINAISADLSEENELFYRAGVRDGVNLDRLVKEMNESK